MLISYALKLYQNARIMLTPSLFMKLFKHNSRTCTYLFQSTPRIEVGSLYIITDAQMQEEENESFAISLHTL